MGRCLRRLGPAPAAGVGRRGGFSSPAGRPRGEPAVRHGAARERGRRRSAYEAPHGSVAPGTVSSGAASARSAGRPYGEAIREASGARRWWVAATEPAPEFLALRVVDAAHLDPDGLDLVFAAVESDAARELEPAYARAVPVISTAAAF